MWSEFEKNFIKPPAKALPLHRTWIPQGGVLNLQPISNIFETLQNHH
jgi:hypothetical protein